MNVALDTIASTGLLTLATSATVVTSVALVLTFVASRRPTPVRVRADLLRLGLAAAGVIVMMTTTTVMASAALMMAALGLGVLLGVAQGRSLRLETTGGQVLASRSAGAVAAWGVGVVIMQVAGITSSVSGLHVGQAISWFGIGILAGVLLGRQSLLRTAVAGMSGAAAGAIIGVVAGVVLLAISGSPVSSDGKGIWVLDSVVTDPEPGAPPPEGVSVTAGRGYISFDFTEAPMVSIRATYDDPPRELMPGEVYTITVNITASITGGSDVQGFRWMDVILLEADGWQRGAGNVNAGQSCYDPVGALPISCTEPESTTGVLTFRAPPVFSGATFRVGVAALNCGGTCYTRYTYRAEIDDSSGRIDPDAAIPEDRIPDRVVPDVPAPDVSDPFTSLPEPEITSDSATAQAIAGLITAVAIGLISISDARALVSSLVGRGPLTPAEAAASIAQVFEPQPPADPEEVTWDRSDPCGFQQEQFDAAAADHRRLQSEIDALRNHHQALTLEWEALRASAFAGAVFDVTALGLDVLKLKPPTPGMLKRMVEAVASGFQRSITKQVLQASASGTTLDASTVVSNAAAEAVGLEAATELKPTGAFGAWFASSVTTILAGNRNYDYLRFMDTLSREGHHLADPAVLATLEKSSHEMFYGRIGPWVDVVSKYVEFWQKNREWERGVHERSTLLEQRTSVGARIAEVEYDLGEALDARASWERHLLRCRQETTR